eukprot:5257845-Prymnesium_polylepis.1
MHGGSDCSLLTLPKQLSSGFSCLEKKHPITGGRLAATPGCTASVRPRLEERRSAAPPPAGRSQGVWRPPEWI